MMPVDSVPEAVSSRQPDSLGVRLRRERERRQIALSSISANTKISAALFESLERGDVSRWPSGIFRRAFIRAYAEAIGLDPDTVAREFLEQFPDPGEPLTAASSPAARTVAAAVPASDAVLRLTLADAGTPFVSGRLLAGMRQRWAAVACDGGVVVAIALGVFVASDTFWLPLGLAMLGYYMGGILLLGNTPGVCLWAPDAAGDSHYNRSSDDPSHADAARRANSHGRLRMPAR
jgi:transcriptional regulator with XRE-family HTH domain